MHTCVRACARAHTHTHTFTHTCVQLHRSMDLVYSAPLLNCVMPLLFAEPTLVLTAWIFLHTLPFPCFMRNSWRQLKRRVPLDLSDRKARCSALHGQAVRFQKLASEGWHSIGSLKPWLPLQQTECWEHTLPCVGTGCEFFWKDWGELGAHGTTQQSFNQQFLTAKPFLFVPMFQDKRRACTW